MAALPSSAPTRSAGSFTGYIAVRKRHFLGGQIWLNGGWVPAMHRAPPTRPTSAGDLQKVAQNVSMSTYVSSRGSSEDASWLSESPSGSWTQPSPGGGAAAPTDRHSPQCRKNLLDHVALAAAR